MSETTIFIVGMLVFSIAIASSIIGTIGTSGEADSVAKATRKRSADSLPAVPK